MRRTATANIEEVPLNDAVRVWTESAEGMKNLLEALAHAAITNEQLQAARMVDPHKLRIPLNL